MAIELDALATYVGATLPRDETELQDALDVASLLVSQALGNPWREVPTEVLDECVRRTAKGIWKARDVSGNTGMLTGADGTPYVGVANDPLQKSWVLIKRYTDRL